MRMEITMKKKFKQLLVVFISICCVLSNCVCLLSISAENIKYLTTSEMAVVGENIKAKKAENGVRITFPRGCQGWERAVTKEIYDTRNEGTTLSITDIESLNDDYSVVVMITNSGGYYDKVGYMIVYGKSGYFSISNTDGKVIDPNKANILVNEIREELTSDLSVRIKLDKSNYTISANGKTYNVTAKNISDPEAVRFTVGVFCDGDIKGLNYNKNFEEGAVSFTCSSVTNLYEGEGYEELGEEVEAAEVGLGKYDNIKTYKTENGIQIGFTNEAAGWSRIGFRGAFPVNEAGCDISLSHIYSSDPNYSIVVRIGDKKGWYDNAGYLFAYGKSGNFSIIATDGIEYNVNKSNIIKSEKREALSGDLKYNLKLSDDKYILTVNNKTYSFPVEEKYAVHPDNIYISFGVWCDGEIRSLDFNKSFKKAAVSFVIDEETYNSETEGTKSIKPFAKHEAFMEADTDQNFNSSGNLTRGAAVIAISKLLVNYSDIEGVYTSDFKDLKSSDKNYSYFAFMERNGFLPEWGEKLEASKSITRKEFVSLLISDKDTSEDISLSDVSKEDKEYKKICFSINSGILGLNGTSEFNPNGTITRGEAAKAICKYIGKTGKTDDLKNNFKDLNSKDKYYDYIILATNELSYAKKTFKADSSQDIQKYINESYELSKSADTKVIIELSDKTYIIDKPITISNLQSSNHELSITIKSAKNANPILSGNKDINISDFKKVDNKNYYTYQFPESSKIEGKYPEFRDLYLNGERLTLARSENMEIKKSVDKVIDEDENTTYQNKWYGDTSILSKIENNDVSQLEYCINIQWTHRKYLVNEILGIDNASGETAFSLTDECFHQYSYFDGNKESFEGWTYYFENHLSLLDKPGEFYYDNANGIVYFYPYSDTDMKSSKISYSVIERIFDMVNASNITFDGLTFTGTTSVFANKHGYNGALGGVHGWNGSSEKKRGDKRFFKNEENPLDEKDSQSIDAAAIYSYDSDRITIKNCTFDELGTNGIYMNGSNRDAIVKGNSFTDISMAGVIFGIQNQSWSYEKGQSNIIIDNNYINNIGTDYKNSLGVVVARVKNLAVTHNSFIHTPYSGLMVGWINLPGTVVNIYNAEIAYNRCEDNLYALNDGAGLYVCGANAMTTNKDVINRIHDNFIKSTGYAKTYNGIYLDMNSSNYKVYNNVIEGFDNVYGPVFNQDHIEDQYTYNNTVCNNFTTIRAVTTTATPDRNIKLIDNKQYIASDELPDDALEIIDAAGQKENYSKVIKNNLTDIKMEVKESHISIPQNGESPDNTVVFTITNNDSKEAKYSLKNTNVLDQTLEMVSSTDELTLKPGKTGTISVRIKSKDKSLKSQLYDMAVAKNNGWEKDYFRVVEVHVTNDIAVVENSSVTLIVITIIGVIVALGIAISVVFLIKKKKLNRKKK